MRIRITIAIILFAVITSRAAAQESDSSAIGIHQVQSDYYGRIYDTVTPVFSGDHEMPVTLKSRTAGSPEYMVFGWHPYWADASAYLTYDYDVLTHISYFSFEVDTASGGYTTLRGWDTTPVISYAHQRGVKVVLTVTNFGSARNIELLTDTVKQWNLINALIYQLQSRNGDGVNFDFESVPSTQKANMVSFCRRVARGIKEALPEAEISLATPAVNWSDGWDLKALSEICDYIIMMGYNYYWSGSSTAGPVAPLQGETYNIARSIEEDYLDAGVLPEKLLLGVPWYGYDWPVTSNIRKAQTTGTGTARTYNSAIGLAQSYGKTFDATTGVPWTSYQNATVWRQMWFDDSLSLQMKSDLVIDRDLAGIGIWALSYESGRQELWKGLWTAITGSVSSAGSGVTPDASGNQITGIIPNPVRDVSVIKFSLSHRSRIQLSVLDTGGKLKAVIADRTEDPGLHDETFYAGDLAPGIYICILYSPEGSSSMKFAVTGKK
jgi:spore germination protein YaaH